MKNAIIKRLDTTYWIDGFTDDDFDKEGVLKGEHLYTVPLKAVRDLNISINRQSRQMFEETFPKPDKV